MTQHISVLPDKGRIESPRPVTRPSRQSWTLRDLATVLFRRKWMMLVLFVTIAGVTIALALLLPDQFQSRMKILVKNARADVVITPEATNSANGGGEVTETQINSEIALLTSKDLLADVVTKSKLTVPKGFSLWRESAPTVENGVLHLEKVLEVAPVKKSDIIEVTYTAKTPELAAAVLENMATLYLEKHLKLHRPPGAYDFFQSQATQYNDQLRDAEGKLTNFQQQNNFVSLEQEKLLNLQKMADAQSRFLDAGAAVKEATERIARLQQQLKALPSRVATQSRSLPNQYSVERLSTMLVELRNRRTQLLTKFQPTDRLVIEVEKQIKDTSAALDNATRMTSIEQSSDLNPLRQTLEAEMSRARLEQVGQQARRDDLAKQVAQYQAVLNRLEQATNAHGDLERQVKDNETNYQLYAKKQEESRIADELDQKKITNVSIAEMPIVQRVPVKPNRMMILGLGLFLALFISMSSALVAEMFRDTVHTPRELELLTDVPVLATIPKSVTPTGRGKKSMGLETELENPRVLPEVRRWELETGRRATS
jgi:polysaccharide biosynthesis protein PslE